MSDPEWYEEQRCDNYPSCSCDGAEVCFAPPGPTSPISAAIVAVEAALAEAEKWADRVRTAPLAMALVHLKLANKD